MTAAVLWGCADSTPSNGASTSGNVSPQPGYCDTRNQGCPCADEGAVVDCGKVVKQMGDYLTCSLGTMACKGGRWGTCEGDQVVSKNVPGSGGGGAGLKALGLGTPGSCANPCSPECATTTDNPVGLDAGAESGLTVTEAGLQLAPSESLEVACTGVGITPTAAPAKDINITGPGPWQVQFQATLLPAGCYTGYFTPLWSIDKFDIADISPTGLLTVVSPVATDIQVRAYVGAFASNIVTTQVRVQKTTVSATDPPAVGVTAASFPTLTGAEPAETATIIYPYNGTMFPLGLPSPLLQWSTADLASGVKVSIRYPSTGTPIFESSEIRTEAISFPTPLLTPKPRATIPQTDWAAFEQSVNRNRATLGDTGAIVLRRYVGGVARQEVKVDVRFAPTQLKGRIYYNTYGTALVTNYSGAQQSPGGAFPGGAFGAATLQVIIGQSAPTVVAGSNSACRVCHSASSDGQMIITAHSNYNTFRYDMPGAGPLGTAYGGSRFIFPGIHPNRTRVLTSAGGHSGDSASFLFDQTGAAVTGGTQPTNLKAAYPTFSHETTGPTQVAFTFTGGSPLPLANPPTAPVTGDGKTLSMMDFDGNRTFSNFRNIYTPPSGKAWWPAFLPPGENGVVWHQEFRSNGRDPGGTRSDCEGGCLGGATAEIWWAKTTGAPTATRLHNLNGYVGNTATGYLPTGPNRHGGPGSDPDFYEQRYNYEPTVLPVVRGGYSWVTFTSRRLYGNVATVNPYASDPRFYNISIEPTTKKLWISALNTGAAAGTDPSFPAFYLPGQELISGNMRGYFVLDACRSPGAKIPANECETDLDCCAGSVCALDRPISAPPKRYCVNASPAACRADGESCVADGECCNFATGTRCASGVCALPPPVYSNASFDREYTGSCPTGYKIRWALFQWKTQIPAGTSIAFEAQTRATPVGAWGALVGVGTSTSSAVNWTSGPQTVAQALAASGQSTELPYLRIRANFIVGSPPTSTPTLTDWRMSYDCIANE
ncbi:MAG: dickkopf-related protein [Polyangiaceae bacterium]